MSRLLKAGIAWLVESNSKDWTKAFSVSRSIAAALIFLQVVALAGCATTSYPVLGIRPDYPPLDPPQEVKNKCVVAADREDCLTYYNYRQFAVELSASYRARATLNEWGLYFAALIGLSGITATAGLAAFNAGIQVLRIVPIVTGFTAGATTVLENRDKANNYTKAANAIDSAVADADANVFKNKVFTEAFTGLVQKVTDTKNDLESRRVELAAREKQLDDIKKLIEERMPQPLILSVTDVTIAEGESLAVKVEKGESVDRSRTDNPNPKIVTVSYSQDDKQLTITGRDPGKTSISFRNKNGISATIHVEVVETETLSDVTAGGSTTATLEVGEKRIYKLPDGVIVEEVSNSSTEIARGQKLDDGKSVVIQARGVPPPAKPPAAADVKLRLKNPIGEYTIQVTIAPIKLVVDQTPINLDDKTKSKELRVDKGFPVTKTSTMSNNVVVEIIRQGRRVRITKATTAPKNSSDTVTLENESGAIATIGVMVQ
jgi:hypothetical protein